MNFEIFLLISCSCLIGACVFNYLRTSRLEDKIHELERRQYFTSTDLTALIKNVEKLVNVLAGKDGTTRDH